MGKFMIKIILLIFMIAVAYCFWSFRHIPIRERKDLSADLKDVIAAQNLGKVLVIYYSLDGNTDNIARRIQKMTNADLFEVETAEPYPAAPAYYWISRKQLKDGKLPQLKQEIPDISSYDLIIIGSPVWWYTISAPMTSFLSKCDFSGKTIVAFATHGGGIGNFFSDFRKQIRNAKVLDGIDFKKVSGEKPKILNKKISSWLNDLEKAI
jgi:flavodoxin